MSTLKHSSNQSRIPFRCSPTRNTDTYFLPSSRGQSTFSFQYRVPCLPSLPPRRNFFSVSSLKKEFSGRLGFPSDFMKDQGFFKPACETLASVRWPEAIMRIPWKMDIHSNVYIHVSCIQHKHVMQRNTCYQSAIQLLSVYPSLAKQWKQHWRIDKIPVNNCNGLFVFRCDNFAPHFSFFCQCKNL